VTADERDSTLAVAAYLQDRVALRDDLLVTPGLRVEHAAYRRNMLRDAVNGVPTDVDNTGSSQASAVLPGIGMVLGSPRLNMFGGLHTGFAPPRMVSSIAPSGRDAHLSAERSVNYEAGARAAFGRFARIEAAAFLVSFFNQVVASTPAFGAQSELINGGRTRHLGAEGSATLALGRVLGLPGALDLTGRYTFVNARFTGGAFDGNRIPYAPAHVAAAMLDLDLDNGLGGQVAWYHVSDQFADEKNTVVPDASGRLGKLDAYDVVDFGARYRWAPSRLTASLLVKNALDDIYISSRRPDGIFTAGFRQITAGLRFDNL
jgi:Fe(3+) dicitrate transport protein